MANQDWKNSAIVVPASEASPWGQPVPEHVASYRIYFGEDDNQGSDDPYDRAGVVLEAWKDGRFSFFEHNNESVVSSLEQGEALVEDYARREGYLDDEEPQPLSHDEFVGKLPLVGRKPVDVQLDEYDDVVVTDLAFKASKEFNTDDVTIAHVWAVAFAELYTGDVPAIRNAGDIPHDSNVGVPSLRAIDAAVKLVKASRAAVGPDSDFDWAVVERVVLAVEVFING